jgi:hypothetical protein
LGIAFSIPIIVSVRIWVFLSDEMNFGGRLQYPALAIGVLSWYPLVVVESSPLGHRWSRQVDVLRDCANGHDFTLAAAYGISSDDTYCYYVKPDIADHDEIVRNIRSMDFSSVLDGVAQNYAGRPESAC